MKETPNHPLPVITPKSSSDSLRVLFISHAYVVGVNQGKLDAIAQVEGVEVGLLAPSNWTALEWNRKLPLECPYSNLHLYSAPVLFPGKVGAHFYAPWVLWKVLKDFKPDIIQVEEEVFSICAFEVAILARIIGKPIVIFGWENQLRQLPLARWKICQYVLNTASAIIPGNQDGADIMRKWDYHGLLEVMPQMGVDPEFFTPVTKSPTSDVPTFRVGFLGRLAQSKGIDLIFSAVAQLRDRGINSQIILCGSGSEEAALRKLAENLQIGDRILWRGAVPHNKAPDELSQFDVLVLPSRSTATWKEQFGHVLIEAMSMGIPVVGSSSGEIPNVIGRSDLIFQEDDVSGLVAILERLVCEPTWRKEVAQYGISRVHQQYSHQKIAKRLVNLWQSVLDGQNGSNLAI
ncbi:MAG: glycosyltransferase [Nostoc desertorum CM1-VF14]|jgi:glycosyltransferase involved in cell wall biosynthesis|nr:glycosyltransferase [Nostoc desertorum CM1-VF14]